MGISFNLSAALQWIENRWDLLTYQWEGLLLNLNAYEDPKEYYRPRPARETKPIVELLTRIGRDNKVNMQNVTPEFLLQCAYEFLEIYEKGGKSALLHRLSKIKTMDNLERL